MLGITCKFFIGNTEAWTCMRQSVRWTWKVKNATRLTLHEAARPTTPTPESQSAAALRSNHNLFWMYLRVSRAVLSTTPKPSALIIREITLLLINNRAFFHTQEQVGVFFKRWPIGCWCNPIRCKLQEAVRCTWNASFLTVTQWQEVCV